MSGFGAFGFFIITLLAQCQVEYAKVYHTLVWADNKGSQAGDFAFVIAVYSYSVSLPACP